MKPQDRISAANRLVESRFDRRRLPPLSADWPGISAEDGYAIQDAFIAAWRSDAPGSSGYLAGYKILLSRRDLQVRFATEEPAYGQLLQDMVLKDGDEAMVDDMVVARVEPEVAFVLGADVGGAKCSIDEVLRATDHVVAALELPQGHMDWDSKLGNVVGDNGGARFVVLGAKRVKLSEIDIGDLLVKLRRNGQEVGTGSTATVLGNPMNAMVWLCRRLALVGRNLVAGQVVMTGSCIDAVSASPGDQVEAEFDHLGQVSVRLA
jgi:2-keto-4-pentenoate hydratase